MRFVDSNVLIYLVSNDPAEADKRERAMGLLESVDLCLSSQVLGEFYVQVTRRTRDGALEHEDALALVESFTRYPVQAVTEQIVRAALGTRGRRAISYWDALIVESARAAGAEHVLSEDLQDGEDFEGVVVRNPFRA